MTGLDNIFKQISEQTVSPVDQWNPDFCGNLNIEIKRDGRWFYEGSLVAREKLVKLFSQVLKKEGDRYFLVTPVEKVGITVDCTPFVVTSAELIENTWIVTNNLGDKSILDESHSLTVNDSEPSMIWRDNLPARINQNVMYQWQIFALDHQGLKGSDLWLESAGAQFYLGSTED